MNKISKQRIYILAEVIFHFLPTKKQIMFVCFEGRQYGDNPRAIAEYIHNIRPDIQLIWDMSENMDKNKIPSYFKRVIHNSIKYAWIKNRSKVVVGNGAGLMLMQLDGWKKILRPFIKKKNQFEIATWHGTPLKYCGADIPNSTYTKEGLITSADVFISGSDFETEVYSKCFFDIFPIDKIGHSRNDKLHTSKNDKLKQKLGIPLDKKVLLYAPTFRADDVNMSGIKQLSELMKGDIFSTLSEKFSGEWVIVYRFHNLVCQDENVKNLKENERFINGNMCDDMADYMTVSDILLTDYSSSFFDIITIKKKCILWIPDANEYLHDRGLYLDFYSMPFPYASSYEELIKRIQDFNVKEYDEGLKKFASELGILNDGNSTKRLVEKYILPHIDANYGSQR